MVEEVGVEATVGEEDGAAMVVEQEHEEATVLATGAEEGEEVVSLHYPLIPLRPRQKLTYSLCSSRRRRT